MKSLILQLEKYIIYNVFDKLKNREFSDYQEMKKSFLDQIKELNISKNDERNLSIMFSELLFYHLLDLKNVEDKRN